MSYGLKKIEYYPLERVLNMTTCTCMYVHYTMQRVIQSVQYDRKQI